MDAFADKISRLGRASIQATKDHDDGNDELICGTCDWHGDAEELLMHLKQEIDRQERKEIASRRRSWEEWKDINLSGAAGKAMRWTKMPVKWEPDTTLSRSGMLVTNSKEILEEEAEALKKALER